MGDTMSRGNRDTTAPVYLHVLAPRCPRCNSTKLRANHTELRSSGARVRHSKCLDCGLKIRIVVE